MGEKSTGNKSPIGYVNEYDFDERAAKSLNRLEFNKPDEIWAAFIVKNRRKSGFTHKYDIVNGPVADGALNDAIRRFESGEIGITELIRRLKPGRLKDQYLFHTSRSLNTLRFLKAKPILRHPPYIKGR